MNITEEVIDKFFTGTCSDQEKEDVARYFEDHPSEADKYFPDWNDTSRWNNPVNAQISNRMLDEIHYAIIQKKLRRKALYYRISSVAAVLLLFAGAWYYTAHKPAINIPQVAVAETPKVITHNNTGLVAEHLILPDGSLVELYPQSTVSYLAGFEPSKRDVGLKGEAVFKVFKDAHRPFTVYSDQISTTALGTRFRVKTSSREIDVTLYEGKVLVKKADDNAKVLNAQNRKYVAAKDSVTVKEPKRYYLNAGNEIVYNIRTSQFSPILNFLMPESKKPLVVVAQNSNEAAPVVMNNISMPSALDMLAEKFNVQIEYSPADVKDINIIATVNPKQSIEQVLRDIAIMNNLRIEKIDSQKFIITKVVK